jgi:hypothetical protein
LEYSRRLTSNEEYEVLTIQLAHGKNAPSAKMPKRGPDAAPVKLSDAYNNK